MNKDDENSGFDFDNDPKFNENFYKNIDMAFNDSDAEKPKVSGSIKEAGFTSDISEENSKLTENNITANTSSNQNQNQLNYPQEELEEATSRMPEKMKRVEEAVESDIEDQLNDINTSLARKICNEMDGIDTDHAQQQKKSKLFKIQKGVLLSFLCLTGFAFFLGFTNPGNKLLMSMGVNLSGSIWSAYTKDFDDSVDVMKDIDYIDAEDKKSDAKEIDPATIVWPEHPGEGRKEEGVYNILLLGEEAIGMGTSRGRTDVIVIATMNTNTKELKLTSLMRDTLVQIPGYKDNKLNSAYEKGGLDLLYQTIALNYDIRLDGCVKVNFEKFEKIIDKLGGVDITLTAGEAQYLNSTNYISKRENRHVVEGKQHMNGNQVLGYARVRKRSTITGKNNDYGRTDRHRIVLNAIFEKYKTKSKVELAAIMFDLMPMITTDIDSDCFELLLNKFIEMGTMKITQLRIPADGAFTDNVKVRGMDVLIPDLPKNISILHTFIFGSAPTNISVPTTSTINTDISSTGATKTDAGTTSTPKKETGTKSTTKADVAKSTTKTDPKAEVTGKAASGSAIN